MLIYLRDIQLEDGGDSGDTCRFDWDYLAVYDSDTEENQIARYCGFDYDTPISLRSTGSNMLLVFKSDAGVTMAGYEAAFYFVPGKP